MTTLLEFLDIVSAIANLGTNYMKHDNLNACDFQVLQNYAFMRHANINLSFSCSTISKFRLKSSSLNEISSLYNNNRL